MMGVWGESNEDEKWQVRGERRSVIRSANILDMGTEELKSAARCLVWPTATRNPFAVGGRLWRDWGRRGSQGTQVWKCIWDGHPAEMLDTQLDPEVWDSRYRHPSESRQNIDDL